MHLEVVLPDELFATQGTSCSLGPWKFASLDAGKISPMLVCHVVCKSHLGLVALITLGEGEGFPLPGHLQLSSKHLAWALKLRNNFSSS